MQRGGRVRGTRRHCRDRAPAPARPAPVRDAAPLEPCLPIIGDVVLGDEQLRLRQADIGGREFRIELDRSFEVLDRLFRVDDAVGWRAGSDPAERRGRPAGSACPARSAGLSPCGSSESSSACVTCMAISSCKAKMSPGSRSKRIDQTSAPVSVSISCVVTRMRPGSLCTLPSSRNRAPSCRPISRASVARPRNANDEVREITSSSARLASWCRTDSAMPEREHLAIAAVLRFWNGSTAIAMPFAPDGAEVRLPHEQHRNRGQQHADDRDIGVATQAVDDRAGHALRRGIARYAPIAGFVEPGERDGHWKAEHRGDDQRDHHPARHAQRTRR